jgi:glycosyltransferase involved in cell wall biosynthesis
MTTPADLADHLLDLVRGVLADLESMHAPSLELPRVFGGHVVGPDARADLAFTLGLLHGEGIDRVAGIDCAEVALEVVRRLNGPQTHSFYSYRAAETIARLGGLDDNSRLAGWTDSDRENARETIDSSSMLKMLDEGRLPNNYAVVLARCEIARRAIGQLPEDNRLDELLEKLRTLFAALPTGWWDDFGGANFDMYTPDVYLFAEPFADELGGAWETGFRRVLADLEDVATPGGAISWGRSTGALGIVMNVELGAVALSRGITDDRSGWLGKAELATRALEGWFERGVVNAHQHKMTMGYRGPERRLQMTLDLLGKLVQAAHELRAADLVDAATPADSYRATDRLVVFDPKRNSGVWAYRGSVDFVLPFVGGFWADYTPSPRWPGTFEVPVDSQHLISWLPVIHSGGAVRTVSGPPAELRHEPGRVEVRHENFLNLNLGGGDDATTPIDGSRRATYRVEGRSLVVDESLHIDADPASLDAVALQVPEVAGRPLAVEFSTAHPHTSSIVDTSGMQEHRSFWNEHVRVHELVLEPATKIDFTWRVTPALRVASSADGHWYDRSLYEQLGDRVVTREGVSLLDDPAALSEFDVFHLHWPEWAAGVDAERTRQVIANLRAAGITILWTQHNRVPHHFPDAVEIYRIWTAEADAVIHHSEYGRAVMEAEYEYGEHTRHAVIPHGHWGHRLEPLRPAGGKSEAEEALGLEPATIRLGIVGAPRAQKDVQLVLDAFHRSSRDDIQLCVWSLGDEDVPDDPRIIAEPYDLSDHTVYARRLFSLDALVMPFTEGMLTTGTMGDALGIGIPTLASNWGYLREALGDAAIYYGETADDLTTCIDALTVEQMATAAAATEERRAATDWSVSAESTLAFLDDVIASR